MSLFEPGKLTQTYGIADRSERDASFGQFVQESLTQHFSGDWGIVDKGDATANDLTVGWPSPEGDDAERILSAYIYKDAANHDRKTKIWIITEADRSVTTVLFPEEY